MSDIKKQVSKILAEEIVRAIKQLTENNNKTYVTPQLKNYRFTTDNLSSDIKKSISDMASNVAVDKDTIYKAVDSALADYEVSAEKIAGLDAMVAEITVLEVKKATIDTAQIENLYATVADFIYMAADKAEIGDLEAEKIMTAIAEMGLANIGSANIDFAQIKDLVSDTAIIREGVGGKLYIDRLAVTDAQILSLTTGELIIQGIDGKLYTVYVDEDGIVQTTLRVVTGQDIDTGTISGDNIADNTITGALITEDAITARELNVSQIFADEALIGAIKAANIDVADLSANEAFVALLTTSLIKAPNFGSELDISKNASIALANNRISLIVEDESSSSELILTEQMLRAISDHIQLIADTIDLSANTSIRLNISSDAAPTSPELDMIWLDTSIVPNLLKRWDGSMWVVVNDTSALENDVKQSFQSIVDLDAELAVMDGKVTAMVGQVETIVSDVDGIRTEVSNVKASLTPDGINAIVEKCKVIENINGDIEKTNQSIAEVSVTADKIYWLIRGDSASAFVLTEEAAKVISNSITLTAEKVNVIADDIDLSSNNSVRSLVGDISASIESKSGIFRSETPPTDANVSNIWVQPSTGYTFQLSEDDGSNPIYYIDDGGVLHYAYGEDQPEYELYMDEAGDLFIVNDIAMSASAISEDGAPVVWKRVKDGDLQFAVDELESQIETSYSELVQRQDGFEATLVKKVDGDELRTYLRYSDGRVELGRNGSRYVTQTSDNGFVVLQDGVEMTSIVQNTVRAPVVEAKRMFTIGDFAFRLGAKGHLILA